MRPFDKLSNPNQGGVLTVYHKQDDTPALFGTVNLPSGHSSIGSMGAMHTLNIAGLATETFRLDGSTDGTNWTATGLLPLDYTTSTGNGNFVAAATLGNGTYKFPLTWPFSHYKFTKSSTTDVASVSFCAFTMPK